MSKVVGHIIDFIELRPSMRARVVKIDPDWSGEIRLLEMGMTVGTEFEVLRVAPLGDPIEICIRGYRLCLRKHETAGVLVEVLD